MIIAASTLKGEEEPVFEAFQRIRARLPEALLIIAPRKPERFDEVEQLARRGGWNVARRTELRVDAEPRHDVIILDTIGELAQLYQVATAVFVGGSLVDQGGHNILEPAVFGKAIVFGPHMQNFSEIARAFLERDAAIQVRTPRELEHALLGLLNDLGPARQPRRGGPGSGRSEPRRAQQHDERGGAAPAAAEPRQRPAIPDRPLKVDPLSRLYAAAARYRRHYYVSHPERRRRLSCPVISIGNLAVGGRAKTPIAAVDGFGISHPLASAPQF